MKPRTDTTLLILTAVFVSALAIVAGAVSFDHMRELAIKHDQTGWKAYAFPISVDGLEIVASLYLVAQRRAGLPTGPIPWVALIVGTAASLAANIAVGGADPIGKALATPLTFRCRLSRVSHTQLARCPSCRRRRGDAADRRGGRPLLGCPGGTAGTD
jgi:hypothetical protein